MLSYFRKVTKANTWGYIATEAIVAVMFSLFTAEFALRSLGTLSFR